MKAKPRKFNLNDYDEYVKKYIRMSEEKGHPISHAELRKEPYYLPDARWLIVNCPDKSVDTFCKFEDWCGFFIAKISTKEKAIRCIYEMQKQLNKPLMYDDFRGWGCYKVGIQYINNTWGSINKMKYELGLEIVQENMIAKQLTEEETVNQIEYICSYINSLGRDFTTTCEIQSLKEVNSTGSLTKYCKKYFNLSLKECLLNKGIKLGKEGIGISYVFEDGERTTSQFEYLFSQFLKNYGLIYNTDYQRDIKYSCIDKNYNGQMNCDYLIHYKEKEIYIEIAGLIEPYKTWYYSDKEITASKTKEKYRNKLKSKENMLHNNNLIYFILFPCDLTKENFINILENPTVELRKNIEKFMKNNIDWIKVRDLGELNYSKQIMKYNQA